jgi:WD40 repeat protein
VLWDPADPAEKAALWVDLPPRVQHRAGAFSVAFNNDGTWLAGAYADGTIQIWNVRTHKRIAQLIETSDDEYHGGVQQISFHSDELLAAAYVDGSVRLWNPQQMKPLGDRMRVLSPPALSVALSHDGRTVAAAGTDGAVHLWHTGNQIPMGAPLTGHVGPVNALAFSSTDDRLVSVGDDQQMRTWDLNAFTNPYQDICAKFHAISETDWIRYAPNEPFPGDTCG